MIGGEKGPTIPKQPAVAAESIIYGSVYDELDDIFEAQDAEKDDITELEDAVEEALQDTSVVEITPASESYKRTLDDILESIKAEMYKYDDELKRVSRAGALGDILVGRKKALEVDLKRVTAHCEAFLEAQATAAEREIVKRFDEAERRVGQLGGEDARILAEVFSPTLTIKEGLKRLEDQKPSKDVYVAFDRAVFNYAKRNITISSKKEATKLASSEDAASLMMRALDADVYREVKANMTLYMKQKLTELASSDDIKAWMMRALDADVYRHINAFDTLKTKQDSARSASQEDMTKLILKAIDADVLTFVKAGQTVAAQRSIAAYASGSIEREAMLRVIPV